MRWIEIITLRTMERVPEDMLSDLMRQMRSPGASEDPPEEIRLCQNATVETDLSFLIHWKSESPRHLKSPLGLQVARAFTDLGLVHHSVWIEQAAAG